MTIVMSLWRTFSRGRRSQHTWRSFVDTFVADPEVVRDKRRVAGFSLASFEGNRRALHRVEQVYGLALDFDQGDTTIKQAAKLLPGVQGVTYTTFSHTAEHPKLRVVYPLARPVDANEYDVVWCWAAREIERAGHVLDESTRDASRFWYLPSHAPGATYEWRELSGDPLDVEGALREKGTLARLLPERAPKTRARPAATLRGSKRSEVEVNDTFFGAVFERAGMAYHTLENGALVVKCPWSDEHTSGYDGDSSTVILPPTSDAQWETFHCSHAHCARRTTGDLLDVLPHEALTAARREHGAGLVRAKIRGGAVQHLDPLPEFAALDRFILRCYPESGGAPLVWTVKLGSRAHVEGLNELPLKSLVGQRVDLAIRGREITWGRLANAG